MTRRGRLCDATDRLLSSRRDEGAEAETPGHPFRVMCASGDRASLCVPIWRSGLETVCAGIAKKGRNTVSEPFKGTVNIDIKDSVPDWAPYTQPIAPEGAPN